MATRDIPLFVKTNNGGKYTRILQSLGEEIATSYTFNLEVKEKLI